MSVFFCKVFDFSLCILLLKLHCAEMLGRRKQHLQTQRKFGFVRLYLDEYYEAQNCMEINQTYLQLLEALILCILLESSLVHVSSP